MQYNICVIATLILCACHAETKRPRSESEKRTQIYTAENPVCAIDLDTSRQMADRGDLASTRKLRDYYWDCLSHDYKEPLKKWGRSAALLGSRTDDNEYMKILQEQRFEIEGKDWESPSNCNQQYNQNAIHDNDLRIIHRQLSYEIECNKSGIDRRILTLAQNAAKIGDADDVRFYGDLMEAEHE